MKIEGPVFPIPPSFDSCGNLDIGPTRDYLAYLKEHGAKNIMTTAGTSGFSRLSEKEIRALNELCGYAFDNFIAGDYPVDERPVLLRYPERWYDNETIIRWFANRSEGCCPVFVHATAMRSGFGSPTDMCVFGYKLVKTLMCDVGIAGVKEECPMDIAQQIARLAHEDFTVIHGTGSLTRFGFTNAQAFLVGNGSFFPLLSVDNQQHRDLAEYRRKYSGAIGWHPFLREGLKYLGLLGRHEREPWPQLSTEQKAVVHSTVAYLQAYAEAG